MTRTGVRGRTGLMVALVALVCAAAPAAASVWCGHNGVLKLSFSDGEGLTPLTTLEPDESGLVMVDLYAVLDEVEDAYKNRERFVAIGGMEMKLVIEGAEGRIIAEDFPVQVFNFAKLKGQCFVGYTKPLRLNDGRATLAHWTIMFRGRPENVVFRLDPGGLMSCRSLKGCQDGVTPMLYAGTMASDQLGDFFAAPYVPAYLNWDGMPDLAPVGEGTGWREVGVYAELD
jgi:hypothetical protein